MALHYRYFKKNLQSTTISSWLSYKCANCAKSFTFPSVKNDTLRTEKLHNHKQTLSTRVLMEACFNNWCIVKNFNTVNKPRSNKTKRVSKILASNTRCSVKSSDKLRLHNIRSLLLASQNTFHKYDVLQDSSCWIHNFTTDKSDIQKF